MQNNNANNSNANKSNDNAVKPPQTGSTIKDAPPQTEIMQDKGKSQATGSKSIDQDIDSRKAGNTTDQAVKSVDNTAGKTEQNKSQGNARN